MRKRLVVLAAVVTGALASVAAAQAGTVGRTGAPATFSYWTGFDELVSPSYVVPAGGGTIVSLNTQSGTCNTDAGFAQGLYDLQVLRPLGGGQYLVLGDTGNQTDPCDEQLHSYPVNIPVQAGDVLGAYVVNGWAAILSTPSSFYFEPQPEPAVGDTITVAEPFSGVSVDESGTLANVPTKVGQCKNGGWKNLTDAKGNPFTSQNACTDFVENNDDQGNDDSQ